jgi:septum formation protein
LILASASTARQALLLQAGLFAEAIMAGVDEAEIKRAARSEAMSADDTALLLAEMKARRVAHNHPDALVIGCDQLLVCEDRWFDKPTSTEDARAHLMALRGRAHTLVTAVVCQLGEQTIWHHVARPKLVMRAFSEVFLDQYLRAEGPALMQTVGGYRLEGLGIHLFDRIDGDYAAILGLPLLALLGYLRQHGVLTS